MKKVKIIVIGIIVVVAALGIFLSLNMPKRFEISASNYDLAALADGVYAGECDNGLVKVQVEVTVKDHAIADIALVRHQNGMGSAAESIVQDVMAAQSVEVDDISGATYSSQTIRRAIENALQEGKTV